MESSQQSFSTIFMKCFYKTLSYLFKEKRRDRLSRKMEGKRSRIW